MNCQPLVSVIVPTFNRAHVVKRAIDSVLSQRYRNVQLIVVDDGSTDETRSLLEKIPEIEYVYQQNAGQAMARNVGLSRAVGTLVASLDSDDYWSPDFLEKAVAVLETEQLDFVFANWHQADRTGQFWDFLAVDPFLRPYLKKDQSDWIFLDGKSLRELYLKACPSPSSSLIMRRSSMMSGWNTKLHIGDDWCLYLDMIFSKPCKAAFTLDKLWYKDVDGSNIYDGRNWNEVVRLLFVEDTLEIINRYRHLLSPDELKVLEKRYIGGLVEHAKHSIYREKDLGKTLSLLNRSFTTSIPYTMIMVLKTVFNGLSNQLNQLKKNIVIKQISLKNESIEKKRHWWTI